MEEFDYEVLADLHRPGEQFARIEQPVLGRKEWLGKTEIWPLETTRADF
jgi:hypothetical protein